MTWSPRAWQPPSVRLVPSNVWCPATGGDLRGRLTPDAFAGAWWTVTGRRPSGRASELLARLRWQVLGGRYRPGPTCRRERPKADGTMRVLSVPSIRDRVAQRAVLDVLGDELDGRLLDPVHGFRRGRSPSTATAALIGVSAPHLEVLQADIASMFDVLPHSAVMDAAACASGDPLWRALVGAWLAAWPTAPGVGVPQGAPLSPALANLTLDKLIDRPLEAERVAGQRGLSRWIRYGDDLTLVVDRPGAAVGMLGWLRDRMSAAGMACKASKTVVSAGELGALVPLVMLGRRLRLRRAVVGWKLEEAT